jgi:hypothetical protein
MKWFLERGQEPSTWRGLTLLASALGVAVSPEIADGIIALGLAVSGLIGALSRG